MQQALTEQY
jgi:hypothetical protein